MSRRAQAVAAGIVLVGIAVRLPAVSDPYSTFHPTRQYRDAVVARDLSYRLWGAPSPEVGEAATFALVDFGPKEPPILESAAAVLRVDEPGGWWRARLLVVAGYLAGVAFLAHRIRRLLGDAAGIASLAVGVLLPYLVHATSSFQPDPIVAGLMCAAFGLLLAGGRDGLDGRAHLAVGLLGGLAAVMKPTALPVVLLPYLWVNRRALRSGRVLGVTLLLAGPAVLWTLSNLVFADTLDSHATNSIVPELLLEGDFWSGWLARLDDVYGLTVLLLAAAGIALAPRAAREVALAGTLGYVAVGLTFTHHMATHDYYHLILMPVVMIGAAGLAVGLPSRVPSIRPRVLGAAGLVLVASFAAGSIGAADDHLDSGADRTATVAGAYTYLTDGEAVTFSRDDGLGLEYLTWSGVFIWPTTADIEFQARGGTDLLTGEAYLERLRDLGVRWFVATVPEDAALVPDVLEVLDGHPVEVCSPDGVVVDVHEEVDGDEVRACLESLDLEPVEG
jgi:hypothetical protein